MEENRIHLNNGGFFRNFFLLLACFAMQIVREDKFSDETYLIVKAAAIDASLIKGWVAVLQCKF